MGAPPHSHPVEEVLIVLAGEVEVRLGESKIVLGSGQSFIVPAGQVHSFQNVGGDAAYACRARLAGF